MMESYTGAIEDFTAGEKFAVDPDAVERELAAVWRAAGQSTKSGNPVTRACLWNVVIHIETRPERGPAPRFDLGAMVQGLPRHLASRALVLRTHPEQVGRPEVQSWISANCILDSGGGKLVCSEEISLESGGDGWKHLPGLVRALLVPGVPTAVVFGSVPDPEDVLAGSLMAAADRVVVHSAACGRSDSFGLAERLRGGRTLSDLGWTSQAELRRAVASSFDHAEHEIEAIREVSAGVPAGCKGDAALALGWVAHCLGASDVIGREPDLATVQTPRGAIRLRTVEEAGGGVSLHFRGEEVNVRVHLDAEGALRLQHQKGNLRRTGEKIDEPALLARTLLSQTEDEDFRSALSWAQELSK